MGNRIYGCDDCQLVCPWNKYAQRSALPDFDIRVGLDSSTLLQLWAWSEADFMRYTEGSAIRRIGHWRWRRNLIVALGNFLAKAEDDPSRQATIRALQPVLDEADTVLQEHAHWALQQCQSA
jgi:epoxyqueuosine reductase